MDAAGEWEEFEGGSTDEGSYSSGLEDESAHLYDVKTPEHYGRHLKKYAKERSKSGQLPGKIGKPRGKTPGSGRCGKQGKNQASCKSKKQTTRSRCADRTWKNFEVSVFILGIRAEGGWSRNHSGEIHPGSSAVSPTGLSTALSETVLHPLTGGTTDASAPSMRPYLSAALFGQGREEQQQADEAPSPPATGGVRDPRDAFLKRLKSAAETPERSAYEALLQRANRLFEELQGPEATPQTVEIPWSERAEYLQRLCRWQRAREDISKELQRGDAKLSGGRCFRDAWEMLRKVSHELVQLGRNCASSVGNVLKELPEMKGNESQRAILTGIRALALLCRERDNVTFDRIYDSSDTICTSADKYTCMAAGGYDMLEGLFAGTREMLRTVLPPPRDPDLRAMDERCQVLQCVWQEVPGLMESVSKLAEVNGPCHAQHGYVLLVWSLVEMALEALGALKTSIRQLPKAVQSERDLLVQSWLPGILCSLQHFVQEVEKRFRMLGAAQEEQPEPDDGGGEEGEGLRRALREAQEQGRGVQEQLFQVTFDVCKHVKDLGGCGRCLNSGVRGLQVLEEVAEKVAWFVHETFADDARYTACRSMQDSLYGSIMTCAEGCLNVLERVKRKLKEEEHVLFDLHHSWNSSGSLMDSSYFDLARQPEEEPPSPSISSPFVSNEQQQQPAGRPAAAPSIQVPGAAGPRQRHHGPPLSLPDGAQISRALLGDLESIPTLSDRDLQLEWKIGDGSFGDVWYGQWYGKQDPVAVKVVALCRDSITNELMLYARSASEDVSDHAATIEAEWEAIRLLPNHENIVTFHSVLWWRPDQGRHLLGEDRGQVLCFVMEYCGYGTLLGMIELARKNHVASGPGEAAEASRMRLQQLRKGSNMRAAQQREAGNFYKHWMIRLSVAHQAASGLAFMHSQGINGIVHRDLASYNILLTHGFHASLAHDRDMIPWLRAKICDFGFSRFLGEEDCGRSDSRPSYRWQAPEVLSPDQPQGSYSRASDVYSFGVVLWEIITLQLPWKGEPHKAVFDAVGRRREQLQWPEPDPWEPALHTRAELQAFVGRCWEPRPEDRPSMQEIVEELGRLRTAEQRARQQQRQLEQQQQADQQQQQQA